MVRISDITRQKLEFDTNTLEEMILNVGLDDDASYVVSLLDAYMLKRGIKFKNDYADKNGNYGVLAWDTSVGYKKPANIGANGKMIVMYCAPDGEDQRKIEANMGKVHFKNKDKYRPYGFTFEPSEFIKVVDILLQNSHNT